MFDPDVSGCLPAADDDVCKVDAGTAISRFSLPRKLSEEVTTVPPKSPECPAKCQRDADDNIFLGTGSVACSLCWRDCGAFNILCEFAGETLTGDLSLAVSVAAAVEDADHRHGTG